MGILTVLLICLLAAAWKAPAWVKEIGLIALLFGVFSLVLGFSDICSALQKYADISTSVTAGGIKIAFIPLLYGIGIYIVSLVIRIVQKPRI